ncbi:MAG: enolase C-terminal domain-like protein, partial [Pseudolabrys sp.]
MPLTLALAAERWPIAGSFAISRGSKTEAVVVVAELSDGQARGRGECVPYARYGESIESVMTQINAMRPQLEAGLDRSALQTAMPPGAARNALDCALWDLEAKRRGRPVHEVAGLPAPHALTTAYTISLAAPAVMAKAAEAAASRELLKVKLGAEGDVARIAAVRAAAPNAVLIVDANEDWNENNLAANFAACADAGVVLVEQPLPERNDQAL